MPKKQWTDEERKAFGEKMKAAKEAKADKQTQKLAPAGAEAGIQQPAGGPPTRVRPVTLLSFDEARDDLDELGVDDWIRKHYQIGDVNIDIMAEILGETREDIYNRLHFLGYPLPEGTYSVSN